VQVTWEDQQHILNFARLNNRKIDLEAQVTAKKVSIKQPRSGSTAAYAGGLVEYLCLSCPPQRSLEDLEDASNELMLSDEEVVRYAVGEVLVSPSHLPPSTPGDADDADHEEFDVIR